MCYDELLPAGTGVFLHVAGSEQVSCPRDVAQVEQLHYAEAYWFPVGVAGAVFLVVAACLGWWYQWSLLIRYHVSVRDIDQVEEKTYREMGLDARYQYIPVQSEDSERGQ
jgi:hypothetical protein